jgi:hypothetical protein
MGPEGGFIDTEEAFSRQPGESGLMIWPWSRWERLGSPMAISDAFLIAES